MRLANYEITGEIVTLFYIADTLDVVEPVETRMIINLENINIDDLWL